MWKVSFGNPPHMKVKRFPNLKDPKATVVTMTATVKVPYTFTENMPTMLRYWIDEHSNPKVNYSSIHNVITIEAKGKVVRQEGDENNPSLAKKIAECKAKMKIYKLMAVLLDKYIEYYVELLVGKDNYIFPDKVKDNSLCAISDKYSNLWEREYKHWIKLSNQVNGINSKSTD